MHLELEGKVAVVTGGSSGIGRAIVKMLISEGVCVANVDRNPDRDSEFSSDDCLYVPTDLTNSAACRNAVQSTLTHFGKIDILVNNAGVNDGAGLSAGPDAFVQSLHRNLVHYYAMAHYAAESLRQSQGCIINIGSKVCETGQGGTSGYAAAKGGVNALTRDWAVELAPHGVRVNCVLPAETWTPLYEQCLAVMPDPGSAKAEIERLIPLGQRFTSADEIAATVVFVASPRSGHTTGQILFVDGGYTHLDRKCTATTAITSFGSASK